MRIKITLSIRNIHLPLGCSSKCSKKSSADRKSILQKMQKYLKGDVISIHQLHRVVYCTNLLGGGGRTSSLILCVVPFLLTLKSLAIVSTCDESDRRSAIETGRTNEENDTCVKREIIDNAISLRTLNGRR